MMSVRSIQSLTFVPCQDSETTTIKCFILMRSERMGNVTIKTEVLFDEEKLYDIIEASLRTTAIYVEDEV